MTDQDAIALAETGKRHAMAMNAASFAHACAHPGDAHPVGATTGAAIQLGIMVSQLVDMGMVPTGSVGMFMERMFRIAEETAAKSIGFEVRP